MPNANRSKVIHHAEKQRHQEKGCLGDDEEDFAIGSVDDRSAQRRKDNPRKAEAKPLQAQVKRRVSELKNEPTLGGGLDQRSRVPEKKTTPENKIIAMAKGTKSVSKEHRPGAVARPSVRSDGPRARMAKRSNEPGEREKSEKNFDCLEVSYRSDMIALVFCDCSGSRTLRVFVSVVIESRRPLAFPRTRHSSIL